MMKPSKSGGKVKQNQLFSLQTHGYSWQDGGMANDTKSKKNPAAVALGRLGGLRGGPARAKMLTAAERKASAQKAALARWSKKKKKA
jgi:hypothetical protein